MQFRRYKANNLKQAMDAAIRDLGSDAVLIEHKKVRRPGLAGLFGTPIYDVKFGYDPDSVPSIKMKKTLAAGLDKALKTPSREGSLETLAETEKLEQRMDSFETTLKEFMDKFDIVRRDITYDYPDEVQTLLSKMIDAQVREELAHSLAKQTEKMMRSKPGTAAAEILEHLLLEQFGRPEPILHKKFTQKVVLILGPTGVGKTTSIIKLAADFAVKQRKKVGIVNTDTYRIGAQEQLQIYAEILGVPLQLVYYPDELATALEEMSDRDLIFVDTAGKKPGDEQHREDLLELMRTLKPEDTLLCLSATTSFSSIKEMVDTYGFIDDYKLMITKLDETRFRGEILNISWYTRKPIAYVTTGQNVPDDIEIADVEKLVKEIIN